MKRIASEQLLGEVEVNDVHYAIVELDAYHYQVVRPSDGRRVGRFRGSPTSMWLLEPDDVELDLLRAIVRSAIAEGIVTDVPTD
jgi:hypothetical protein